MPCPRNPRAFSLFALVLASISSIAPARAGSTFVGIGDLTGGTFYSRAHGISADGSTVVGSSVSSAGLEVVRWTSASGLIGLGDLPGGPMSGEAFAVSATGSVIVGSSISSNGTEAFRWEGPSGFLGLGDLAGSTFFSEAFAVNSDGSVIVGRGRSALSGPNFEAFRWTSGTGIVGLGDFAGSSFSSTAKGVSGIGSTVVGLGSSILGTEACQWISGSGISGVGDLAGGGVNGVANAVSGDGNVIVGWSWSSLASSEAFKWDLAHGVVGLGLLPSGFGSAAYAVTADGSIVVGDCSTTTGTRAMIWDATHGMRDLQALLLTAGLPVAGWKLERATGISADGSVIVGWGTDPSNRIQGWIAVLDDGCAPGVDSTYGIGKPGSTGTPQLTALSPPVLGQDSPIRIAGALPGALPSLAFGFSAASLPFDGGTLLVAPLALLSIPLPIALDGTLTLHGVIPNDPALCGVVLYFQALYIDPAAAGFHHVALTNGLKRTIGGP